MSDAVNRPPDIHLHPGKEKGLLRGHPWVFSGAIQRMEVDAAPPSAGDWVRVFSSEGQALGWGHWGEGSIAVRILAEGKRLLPPDADWWVEKLSQALLIRRSVGFNTGSSDGDNNCFRWIHGEGDGLSGLVIDLYGTLAVVQTHTMGMHKAWGDIESSMRSILGNRLDIIVDKSAILLKKLPGAQQMDSTDGVVWSRAEAPQHVRQEVREHGIRYVVDPLNGQKTGFFLDQRDNRRLLMEWVGTREVLNAFSYTGGFSMAALKGGSPKVISLDASELAVEAACHHAELNGYAGRHEGVRGDVMAYLREKEILPPVVILDPPAYAKSRANRHKAVQGYKRLNALTMTKMPEDSLLWTFSCSQVVDAQLFEDTIIAAAVESGRTVRILRRLGQPADHPTLAGHPEAQYLKGLVLHIF